MGDQPAPGRELVRPAIATEIPSDAELVSLGTISDNLGKSGMFPDARNGQQAFAKIMLGRSIGLGPMQAMTGIHVVEGKPQLAATTLLGFVRQSERYDYRILFSSGECCLMEFGEGKAPPRKAAADRASAPPLTEGMDAIEAWASERWEPWPESLGLSPFTIADAKQAGLGKWPDKDKWTKSQWGKWPRNMNIARCASNGVRWYCPDLFGGVPVYTEADEFESRVALTDGSGDGEPTGIELGPEVEAVLARAESLGHAALANRAAVEVQLGGQDAAVVQEWVASATTQLDAMEPGKAEVVEPTTAPALRAASAQALERSERWAASGDEERAAHWKEQADTYLQSALGLEEGGGVSVETRKVEGGGDDAG